VPVIPSIQSLVGDHSGGENIGVDWTNLKAFQVNTTHISRYGLISGAEEAFAPLADMGGAGQNGYPAPIGVAASGDIFISSSGSLYNGASMLVDGDALTVVNLIGYPSPKFGQGGMIPFDYSTTQYALDFSVGGFGFSYFNEINATNWEAAPGFVHDTGIGCAGPSGSGIAYVFSAVNLSGVQTGPATLSTILYGGSGFVSNTVIGDVAMTDIDAGWTSQFVVGGMCLDQTDDMLLVVFSANGNSNKAYLAKIDPADASIVWKSVIPTADGGGAVSTGIMFAQSSIQNQRVAFYTGSPATVTIYDTSDGSVDTTYSTGLDGLSNIDGQCYNDTLGCIVLGLDFSNTTGSPTLLNSTPTSWGDGYAVLYVAAGISPTPVGAGLCWVACLRATETDIW
jgi:hypothetical protein